MAVGELTLTRFNGVEKFRIHSGGIIAYKTENGVRLCFEMEAEPEPVQTLPDTLENPGCPAASVHVDVQDLRALQLVGLKFHVPKGSDEDGDERGRFYYYEHEDMNDNTVEILERRDKHFRARWTGTTMDVNYYDGSKPHMVVQIEPWFYLGEMEKWSS